MQLVAEREFEEWWKVNGAPFLIEEAKHKFRQCFADAWLASSLHTMCFMNEQIKELKK